MQTPIAWFPGHMAKARRQIEGALRLVDAVIVVVDARAPATSANPDLESLIASRQQFIVLTKADLADPEATEAWLSHFRNRGMVAAAVDLRDGASRHILTRGLLRLRPKGRTPGLKVMVVGTPNVGKSTLINRLAGRATARTGARPGVTRGSQWIHIGGGVRLLDTPGLMWPKLESVEAGLKLRGSVRSEKTPMIRRKRPPRWPGFWRTGTRTCSKAATASIRIRRPTCSTPSPSAAGCYCLAAGPTVCGPPKRC